MKEHLKKIKTCVNCRHLEILEEGQEVVGLEDTSYIVFRCDIFNFTGKEVFRFPVGDKRVIIEKESEDDCPFWEEWIKECDDDRGLISRIEGKTGMSSDDPDDY